MNKSIYKIILFVLSVLLLCTTTITPAYGETSIISVSNKSLLAVKSPSKIAPLTDIEPEEWTSVMESVYQDVYEPADPELDEIQAKLDDLEHSKSKRLFTFSLSEQPVKIEESALSAEQVNTLVEDGAEVLDVYWLEYLTRINGNDPLEMWNYQQENNQSWEEVQEHYELASSTSPSVTEEVYESSVMTMNRNLSTNTVSIAATSDEDSDLDNKIQGAFDNLVKQQILQGTTKSQFAERTDSTEDINQSSGSLTWKEAQISLPGRDGLDLNIGVSYNSGQSSPYTGYSTPKGTASIMKKNYFASRYDLGLGWEFQFPSLEGAVSAIASLTYHDGQGGIKAVDFMSSSGIVGTTHIQDSQNKTQVFMIDNKKLFSNGVDFSEFYMEYGDQKREYFSGDGRLLGIVDRFGNQISYHYQNRTDFLGESKLMISSITDSVGRTVEFQYDSTMGQGEEFQGEDIRVIVKDSSGKEIQRVTYTKGRVATNNRGVSDGYAPILSKITNSLGESEVFDYDFLEGSFRYVSTKSSAPRSYALLKKVTYPRSITQYQYESATHKLGKKGQSIDYRILSREDWDLGSNNAPINRFNHVDYTYTGDYTAYPEAYDRLSYKPEDYRYQQTTILQSNSNSNGMRKTYTFDGNQKLLTTEIQNSKGELQKTENLSFHTDFKYSPTKTQTIQQDADGSTTRTSETVYTDWGGVQSQTDALIDSDFNNATIKAQHTVNYTYQDQFKLLTSKSWYQDANKLLNEKYTYTSDGRPSSVTNSIGENTIYSYQSSPLNEHQIKQVTVSKLVRSGVTSTVTTSYGEATNYAYPTEQTQSITNTAKDGSKNTQVIRQQTKYDMGTGLPVQQIDSNGKATTTTYDTLGRPVKIVSPSITNLDGTTYAVEDQYAYTNRAYSTEADSTNAGVLTMRVDAIRQYTNTATGAITVLSRQSSYYDGFGFLRVDETYNESNGWMRSQYHPDDQGRAIYAVDPLGNTQTASYDAWGQQAEATDAYGNLYITANHMTQRKNNHFAIAAADVSAYRANTDNRSIRLNTVEQSYDVYGNLTTTTAFKDGAAQNQPIQESYTYDLQGNILTYIDPNQTKNSNGVTSNYTYDALNRLTAVQDGLYQTTRYAYDGTGGLTKITVNAPSGQSETLYTKAYNEAGQLTDKTDTSGKNTASTYSSRGLVEEMRDRNGTTTNYQYDERGQRTVATLTASNGNILQTKTIFGSGGNILTDRHELYLNGTKTATQTSTIDKQDRITSLTSTGTNQYSSRLDVAYDTLDRITNQKNSLSGTSFFTNYGYDKLRLSQIQTNGAQTRNTAKSANVNYEYTPLGMVKAITFPTLADGSVLKESFTYDALNRLSQMSNTKGSSTLSAYRYTYDNNGNILTVSESLNGGEAKTSTYTYDKLNRLATVQRIDGSTASYTYDLRGNRKTMSDTQEAPATKESSYSYDADDRLTSATIDGTKTSIDYLPNGLRFQKTTGTVSTQYSYDPWDNVTSEKVSSGAQSTYIYGDRILLKKDQTANKDYYYLSNGHGDIVQMVDTTGAIVNSYGYDEWGNLTQNKETVANNFKYAGEAYDSETGLYYLKARYYDPSQGRFLKEDSYEGQITNPLTLNSYTYVENNPVNYVDPTGNASTNPEPSNKSNCCGDGGSGPKGGISKGSGGASISKSVTESSNGSKTKKPKTSTVEPIPKSSANDADLLKQEQAAQNAAKAAEKRLFNSAMNILKKVDINTFTIKSKHLDLSENATTRWTKFNVKTPEEANNLVDSIIKSARNDNSLIKKIDDNKGAIGSEGEKSFRLWIDAKKAVGTKGETGIRLIYDEEGKVWNAFPDKMPN